MNKSSALLKYKRITHKMTQRQLADLLGVHSQFISNIERSTCLLPGPYVEPLCKALKINKKKLIDYIMEDIRHRFYRV